MLWKTKVLGYHLSQLFLPFTNFSSLKEIFIMKSNCEKQALINQVFLTNTILKIVEK